MNTAQVDNKEDSSAQIQTKKRGKRTRDPNKPKRELSEYNVFMKQHIGQFKHLPPPERMSKVAELWNEHKKSSPPKPITPKTAS